ncbi:response regulator [Caballeronia arvi]|nr:response regulator [Caballeronia arvi]
MDDDEPTRDAVSELLRMLGHRPTTAPGAKAALDAIDNAAFDVLLTDVRLPDISGIELAGRIAKVHKGISVIFASGDTIQDNNAGDFPWQSLRKPYTVDQLEAALRKTRQDDA